MVAPRAASRQAFLQTQLSQLGQQQASVEAQLSAENPTQVLSEAEGALPTRAVDGTALAAAFAGLLAALALIASIGSALTARVAGPARWERSTRGVALGPALVYRRSLSRARHRRAKGRIGDRLPALLEVEPPGPLTWCRLPIQEPGSGTAGGDVLAKLGERGFNLNERSLREALDGVRDGKILIIVDAKRCTLSDVHDLEAYVGDSGPQVVSLLVAP